MLETGYIAIACTGLIFTLVIFDIQVSEIKNTSDQLWQE